MDDLTKTAIAIRIMTENVPYHDGDYMPKVSEDGNTVHIYTDAGLFCTVDLNHKSVKVA